MATALAALMSLPAVPLAHGASPVHPMDRLAATLGAGCPRLFIKRDDLLSFAFGGNKVRKMEAIAAEARAAGADTLITCGGLQSNHARVTAAAGASLGLRVVLVLNGDRPAAFSGNLRLDELFGADIRCVPRREDRAPAMEQVARELAALGRRPFIVPLGASTPTGALGFARGMAEILSAGLRPTAIVHATSSGGTQAGLIAGCALLGLPARVVGISADDGAEAIKEDVTMLLRQIADRVGGAPGSVGADRAVLIDDGHVGDGYGIPTPASTEALTLAARTEGVVLDPVYTAKAMAGLLAMIRRGEFEPNETVLFWHTGGVPAFFS